MLPWNEVKIKLVCSRRFYVCVSTVIALAMCSVANAIEIEQKAPESDIGLAAESAPQEKDKVPTVNARIVSGAPVIDGKLDDEFWQQAARYSLDYELYPVRLDPPAQPTEAMIGLTPTHLYVAFVAHDPDPSLFRSAIKERDSSKDDDYVSIVIDPTAQGAKLYEFRVTPHGVLTDVLQDNISDRYLYDWDTDWQAAAKITEPGYVVEMAIPRWSLKLPRTPEGDLTPGLVILKRSYPRSIDSYMVTFFRYQLDKESIEQLLALEPDAAKEERDKKRLKLTPHIIYHPHDERGVGDEWERSDEHELHAAGFGLKYYLSNSSSLNLTVNPNFTEVEADIARDSINNPFIPFKPEKREFFQDVGEYFTTQMKAVYTRNIIEPEIGFSYLSSEGKGSVGAFWVNDRQTEVIMPDTFGSDTVELTDHSKSGAFHVQFPKGIQTIGLLGTYRSGESYHNTVLGVDGIFNLGIDDKLRYQLMFSNTDYPERFADDLCEEDDCTTAPPPEPCYIGDCPVNAYVLRANYEDTLRGHGLRINYKHDGPDSLYWVNYWDIAPDFRADLGFVRQVDLRAMNLAYGRKWYFKALKDDEGESRVRAYATAMHLRSHESNDKIDTSVGLWGEFRGSYQSLARAGYRVRERAVNRIDQGSLDVGDNAPLFDENYWQWYFQVAPLPNTTFHLDGRWGEMADADNMLPGDMRELKPKINIIRDRLEFMLSGTFRNFDVTGGELYKEQFLSLTLLFRQNEKLTHRFLYLDDLTERNLDLWVADEDRREKERTLEYTLLYKPTKDWKILTGVKFGDEYDSDLDETELTNREYYLKIEKDIHFSF